MPAETVSDNVETLINLALAEDFGSSDVTSTYFVPEHLTARAILTPRKKGVLSGVNVAAEVFREIPDLTGNLVFDAHTAILMRENGVRVIYTRDTDFKRFPFLTMIDPVAPAKGKRCKL